MYNFRRFSGLVVYYFAGCFSPFFWVSWGKFWLYCYSFLDFFGVFLTLSLYFSGLLGDVFLAVSL